MIASSWLALTNLWSRAIDLHEQHPLTAPAALAAHAVEHEDLRRRGSGIPSIFEPSGRSERPDLPRGVS
jgi:hypothetical protein